MRLGCNVKTRFSLILLSCAALAAAGGCAWAQNLLVVGPGGTPEEIRALVAAGADLEARSEGNMTPLMATASNGPVENVLTLLELGADPLATSHQGYTALHYAANRMDEAGAVIEALIVAGSDVNARTREGRTALIMAAGYGTPEAVEALIRAGADLDVQDDYGANALINAARYGYPASVLALLDAGAATGVEDANGRNALSYAEENPRFANRSNAGVGQEYEDDYSDDEEFDLEAFLDEMEATVPDFDREAFLREWEAMQLGEDEWQEDGDPWEDPAISTEAYERLQEAER